MSKIQSEAHHDVFKKSIKKLKKIGGVPVIVDIGANNGKLAARYYSELGDFVYWAVEPSSMNCKTFEKNTAGIPGITLLPVGIGSEEGSLEITEIDNPEMGHISSLYREHVLNYSEGEKVKSYKVPIITMEDLVSRVGTDISLLKVNCEGSEYLILSGEMKWISGVKLLSLQLHITPPFDTAEYDKKRSRLYSSLLNAGLVFKYGDMVFRKGLKCLNQLWVRDE